MKKLLVLALALVLALGLVGCGKQQAVANQPTEEKTTTSIMVDEQQVVEPTQPIETIEEETEPVEVETEPQELNPYEEYISSTSKGKYLYEDLDGDGEQELFISRNNRESEFIRESEIITIVDGEPIQVMENEHLFLCEDGVIGLYSEGAGGQTVIYYRLENLDAIIIDVIMTENDGTWYRGVVEDERYISSKTLNRITEEEAKTVVGQYGLLEDIPWYLPWVYGEE